MISNVISQSKKQDLKIKLPKLLGARRYSLSHRFIYALIGVSALVLVLFTTTAILYNLARTKAQVNERIAAVSNLSKASLSSALWLIEEKTINDIARALLMDQDIVFVNVLLDDQIIVSKKLAQFSDKRISFFEGTPRQYRIKTSDIFYGDRKLGAIQLVISLEKVHREFMIDVWWTIAFILLILIAIFFTSLLILRKHIFSPLLELEHSAIRIADGKLDSAIDVHREDEIGKLARVFDGMRKSIKELIEEVTAREKQYRTLLNNLNVGVFRSCCEQDSKLLQVNTALVRIFGYDSKEELLSIRAEELYENPEMRQQFIEKLKITGETKNHELPMKRKDGSQIWASISATIHYDEQGNYKWLDGLIENITERKQDAEKIEQLNKTFEKFVPRQFLHRIATKGIENIQLGEAQSDTISILFSDIRAFTNLSENMPPQNVLNFLNSYLQRMNQPIHDNHGFIDKFIGDAILALFDRTQGGVEQRAQDAVQAAISMQEALKVYNNDRKKSGYAPIQIGVGIHSGPVIIGTVGSDNRMDSTVLGDTVNLAARLEELTKSYNARIIASFDTIKQLEDVPHILWRKLDFISVKGKEKPVSIFEIFNCDDKETKERKMRMYNQYHEGLMYYYSGDWNEALKLFRACLKIDPDDVVSRMYVNRCLQHRDELEDEDTHGALIPERSDNKWKQLVLGKKQHQFQAIPAAMLMSKLIRKCRQDSSPENIEKSVAEIHSFFIKYEAILGNDIKELFG